ncbi:MAG: hypothetical protein IJU70_00895 [Lentisphaeria bacterium]|nr:hypothetical protein [Lentisphaeria bacterium]
MSEENPELLRIASLLDDPDENTALNAMAELLAREDELGSVPGLLHESKDPLMRRRVHQLEAALLLRRRRKYFLSRLCSPGVDFLDLLVDVHLQWFDNDSRPEIEASVAAFCHRAAQKHLCSLEDIASFMTGENITAEPETTLKPELYCIGSILSEHSGAASVLAALACRVSGGENGPFFPAYILDDFAVCDGKNRILLPERSWRIIGGIDPKIIVPWDMRNILRLASSNLFSAAVNSDSFRYILTIAQSLSGTGDDRILDFLPYPYHPADDPPHNGS